MITAVVNGCSIIKNIQGRYNKVVEIIFKFGAEVNKKNNDGDTALTLAAKYGNVEVVECLTRYKHSQNRKYSYSHNMIVESLIDHIEIDKENNDGETALILAAKNGHTEIVKTLIESGADIKRENNNGETALILAAKNGHTEIVKTLIESGAEVNKKNNDGDTALIIAAKNGHTEIVKTLIESGADIKRENNNGETALILAAKNGHIEIVELLNKFVTNLAVNNEEGTSKSDNVYTILDNPITTTSAQTPHQKFLS